MAKKERTKEEEDIVGQITERYKEASDGWDHVYKAATDDMCFVYDVDEGQWPDKIKRAREADGRPVLTVNKILKFVRQVRGDQMQNRSRIKVIPVDDKADVEMAKLYNGLIRQIEYLSSAEIAYDTAYSHSISASIGYFRIATRYANAYNFDQEIVIKRIINPLTVHFDPYAEEFTLNDARYCFVEEMLEEKEYQRRFPNAEAVSFSGDKALFGEWLSDGKVRIAEYFHRDFSYEELVQLETGEIFPLGGKLDWTEKKIADMGGKIKSRREAEIPIIRHCRTNGYEMLEKSVWPGKDIPIIPVLGDEVVVNGKRYYLSLARGAKGPQQMYNYWATAATETVALAPKMPFIVDHRQVAGFETEWEEANTANRMFIRYKSVAGLQKPTREPQAQVPNAIMAMLQNTAFDIEDHLGRYESSKGEASNERSGKAIMARVAQSDKGTFTFVDNLSRAITYAGRQLIDLIPKIYDTPRAIRIQGEDGSEQLVKVNQPTGMQNADGSPKKVNDLSVGEYDLVAIAGASYGTRRQEMVKMLIEAMQYAPQVANVIVPLIFKNSDFPGADEVAAAIKGEVQRIQQMEQQQGGPGAVPAK